VPVYNTVVRITGDDGQDLLAGQIGEIVTSGPMVVPRRPWYSVVRLAILMS